MARADAAAFEVLVTHLRFTEPGSEEAIGGSATTVDGVISMRRSNGTGWLPMTGNRRPIGT